jgi:hypothetical protein
MPHSQVWHSQLGAEGQAFLHKATAHSFLPPAAPVCQLGVEQDCLSKPQGTLSVVEQVAGLGQYLLKTSQYVLLVQIHN